MRPVCEVVVKIIPALRAHIAKELIDSYGLNQAEVAEKLGVSQPAVSQYLRQVRGTQSKIMRNKIVEEEVKQICKRIADGEKNPTSEFCGFCRLIREHRLVCAVCGSKSTKKDSKLCMECF
jgi:hypothetical protein